MYKLGEYITYDDSFFRNAMSLLSHYQVMGIDTKCILLEKNENKEILEKMISLYTSLECDKNPIDIIPKKLKLKEITELANSILISILPSFEKQILQYDNLLYFYDEFPFSSSCYNYKVTDQGIIIPQSIDISNDLNEYSISVINHEKIHTLMMEKMNLKKYLGIYMELLSFLIQKITNYNLIKENIYSNSFIIDSIVRAVDNQKNIDTLDILREINLVDELVESHFTYHYLNLKANEYLIADWYSELLFKYYLSDSLKMKDKINQVFNQKITVQDLLDYYQVSLSSDELFPCVKEKLNDVKKYVIKL